MRKFPKFSDKKSREELNAEGRERKRLKKHKGHKAGSRANPDDDKNRQTGADNMVDKRIGSKKPIQLIVDEKQISPAKEKKPAKQKLTPAQELEMLESDEQLDALLERLEQGGALSREEQNYVDSKLDRIDELMAELGIELDEDEEPEERDDIMRLLK